MISRACRGGAVGGAAAGHVSFADAAGGVWMDCFLRVHVCCQLFLSPFEVSELRPQRSAEGRGGGQKWWDGQAFWPRSARLSRGRPFAAMKSGMGLPSLQYLALALRSSQFILLETSEHSSRSVNIVVLQSRGSKIAYASVQPLADPRACTDMHAQQPQLGPLLHHQPNVVSAVAPYSMANHP